MNTIEEKEVHSSTLSNAVIKTKKGFSIVWVIPLVAVMIAAGLVYKAVTEKGPTITITFESADGLEAGKTKIKYKEVEIGEVENVAISKDLKNVIVTAQLIKQAKTFLTEKTRFWVVRARFSGGIASGLGTLFSGSYIEIDPGQKGEEKTNTFVGLEIPPVVTSDLPGSHFQLTSTKLGSLEYGSPIYFKGMKVGQVVGYAFSDQKSDLDIKIFIDAPYDSYVFSTTRFWLASGLDMVLDANGVRIDTQSFVSLMVGGLAFANPDNMVEGPIAEKGHVFPLYNSSEDAMAMRYTRKDYYLLKFDNSVRGLSIGAPVEFRGFPFGKVIDIGLEADWENKQLKIPVKIEVEPERLRQFIKTDQDPADTLEMMVSKGMRAQLKTGNLITGSKYVAIDLFSSADSASIKVHDNIIELPTIPASLDELTGDIEALLDKLSKIPFDEIGAATLDTIHGIDQTSRSFRKAGEGITQIVSSEALKNAVNSLDRSLAQIQRLTAELEQKIPSVVEQTTDTLEGIENIAAPDSALFFELRRALKEFSKAAQNISSLADYLEKHPESIIQGKGNK